MTTNPQQAAHDGGLRVLEARRDTLKPGAPLWIVRTDGEIDKVFAGRVSGEWRDQADAPANVAQVYASANDIPTLCAHRLVVKVGLLPFLAWRDALMVAVSQAGSPGDPYAGRYNGWAPQDIAEDWIKCLANGGRVEAHGSSFVVRP